jgi:hypothetical protein
MEMDVWCTANKFSKNFERKLFREELKSRMRPATKKALSIQQL